MRQWRSNICPRGSEKRRKLFLARMLDFCELTMPYWYWVEISSSDSPPFDGNQCELVCLQLMEGFNIEQLRRQLSLIKCKFDVPLSESLIRKFISGSLADSALQNPALIPCTKFQRTRWRRVCYDSVITEFNALSRELHWKKSQSNFIQFFCFGGVV